MKSNNDIDEAGNEGKLFWFPFYIDKWHSNLTVRLMTDFQKGWYISLLLWSWPNAGTIENNPAILWRLAGAASPDAFDRDKELVLSQFKEAELDGKPVLVHVEMARLHMEQSRKYSQRVEAGKKSAEIRARGRQADMTDKSAALDQTSRAVPAGTDSKGNSYTMVNASGHGKDGVTMSL